MIPLSAFARQITSLGGLPPKVAIAVSGGADSMCLAYLLARYRDIHQPHVHLTALTIDHGFRPGLETEARSVGQLVQAWGISHTVHRLSWPTPPRLLSNFEEEARTQRLQVLGKFCLDRGIGAVFMGHNQNDLVETYLQRLQMNSTVYGLVALRAKSAFPDLHCRFRGAPGPELRQLSPLPEPISIYRPLLPFKKAQIVATCRSHRLTWFEDASNSDIHLTKRNMLRYAVAEVVPRRPGLLCLSHSSLVHTIHELQALVASLEEQVAGQDFPDLNFDACRNRLSFSASLSELLAHEHLDFLVFSRWLFLQLAPLSATKHLHWGYAKIHRHLMPALASFVRSHNRHADFCYLNVKFRVSRLGDRIHFSLSNEVPRHYEMEVTNEWKCFGGLWWMRSDGPAYKARFYHAGLKRQLLASFPCWGSRGLMKDLGNVPVVMSGQRVVGVPTWNRWVQDALASCVPVHIWRRDPTPRGAALVST